MKTSQSKPALVKGFFKKVLLKKPPKLKVSANTLIVSRKESEPIYLLSKTFHLISRPLPLDPKPDIGLSRLPRPLNYDYTETGLQKYFSKDYMPPRLSPKIEFPHIKRKIFTRMCKGIHETEAELIPYNKRIRTVTDLESLKSLSETNKELRYKIGQVNKTLNKTMSQSSFYELNSEENNEKSEEKKIFRRKSELKYVKLEKKVPVKDFNWQRIIRRTAKGLSLTMDVVPKREKISGGIVDVSYSYCKCCKREWRKDVEIQIN